MEKLIVNILPQKPGLFASLLINPYIAAAEYKPNRTPQVGLEPTTLAVNPAAAGETDSLYCSSKFSLIHIEDFIRLICFSRFIADDRVG